VLRKANGLSGGPEGFLKHTAAPDQLDTREVLSFEQEEIYLSCCPARQAKIEWEPGARHEPASADQLALNALDGFGPFA
jgi:hypothetical protein